MTLNGGVTARTKSLPILCNPFHLLGVSPCDNRQRIVEAAEEKVLSLDGEVCAKARADLTHPRNRLAAELAWLPGLSSSQSQWFIEWAVQDAARPFRAAHDFEGRHALRGANLMASAILALDSALDESEWVSAILAFSRTVEEISTASVLAAINDDRTAAGFAVVKAVDMVEEGLAGRRQEFRECLRDALDTLPPRKLARVVATAAETATRGGAAHPPVLIDGLIDVYAIGTHAFLTKEAGNVMLVIDRIRRFHAFYGKAAVDPLVGRLETVVRNWHSVARPIQVLAAAKGTSHRGSWEIANAVRGVGLYLGNNGMPEQARRIILLTREAFGHLLEIVERAADDARALDELIRRNVQS
jgi:hypothetical protein